MNRMRLIVLVFLLISGTAAAQDRCATMLMDSLNRIKYPQRGSLAEFEEQITRKINEMHALEQQGRVEQTVLTIPIIVHVVNNGEAVGVGTNLSQAQVSAQLEVLNEDFRKIFGTPGYNTNPVGADIEIEFCLSSLDEDGNEMAEPGINRIHGSKSEWSREDIENQLKPTTIWNPNLFYNIWTVKFSSAEPGLLGYAQFPDQSGLPGLPTSGPALTDGVVIRYTSFGSTNKGNFPIMQAPYDKGRTLTHETGHYLGLRHIWGDGNCANDFVADTPPASGPSSGCPVGRISCGGVNMIENYMDYSNDGCMNIFTEGQKARMRAVMTVSPRRKTLLESNLCTPTVVDPPVANFTSDADVCVLSGSVVSFVDLSTNFPNEWHWGFEGGDPNVSSLKNPKVKYSTAGNYKVTMWTLNAIGSSDTLRLENYVSVSSEGLCKQVSNYDDTYTASLIKLSSYGNYSGYLTGQNSARVTAVSERFTNDCGYKYVSGADIRFARVHASSEASKATIVVWNARGSQGAPGSVIERKEVLLKQIQEDIDNNTPTSIVFDRETPVFGASFHVGIEFDYESGDTVVVSSSADGEALNATSWMNDSEGEFSVENGGAAWAHFAVAIGANIALDIRPYIGMQPSVQVSASTILAYPGEEVVLNGRGASIFVWSATDGSVGDIPGPQLVVHPQQTTTYLTIGSGLDLCYDSAYTTVYVRENVTGIEQSVESRGITVYPNPGSNQLIVRIENNYVGEVTIGIHSVWGRDIIRPVHYIKQKAVFEQPVEASDLVPGMYLVTIRLGNQIFVRKWVKI